MMLFQILKKSLLLKILSRRASFQHNMKWVQNALHVAITDSSVFKKNKTF